MRYDPPPLEDFSALKSWAFRESIGGALLSMSPPTSPARGPAFLRAATAFKQTALPKLILVSSAPLAPDETAAVAGLAASLRGRLVVIQVDLWDEGSRGLGESVLKLAREAHNDEEEGGSLSKDAPGNPMGASSAALLVGRTGLRAFRGSLRGAEALAEFTGSWLASGAGGCSGVWDLPREKSAPKTKSPKHPNKAKKKTRKPKKGADTGPDVTTGGSGTGGTGRGLRDLGQYGL